MIAILDQGRPYSFSYDAMSAYHGPVAPGGVAHAYKVMKRAFAQLSPDALIERRELLVRTTFPGPGARDAIELVTRTVTGGRYDVSPDHAKGFEELGYRAKYVFTFEYRGKTTTVVVRDGIVRQEFLALAGKSDRSADEEIHLGWLKDEMAERIMRLHESAVYDVASG